MTDRGERTKCQFKRIEGYLIIDSKYYGSEDDVYSTHSIFVKNEYIFWLYKNFIITMVITKTWIILRIDY